MPASGRLSRPIPCGILPPSPSWLSSSGVCALCSLAVPRPPAWRTWAQWARVLLPMALTSPPFPEFPVMKNPTVCLGMCPTFSCIWAVL